MTWIQQSLSMRGLLSLWLDGGKYRAQIVWPLGYTIEADGDTAQEAIANLEIALCDDCAQEMIDKGVV